MTWTRRLILRDGPAATAGALALARRPAGVAADLVLVDPRPLFALSPHFHMQLMELLGLADGSVAASWDWDADD
jgi:hypothetical protein